MLHYGSNTICFNNLYTEEESASSKQSGLCWPPTIHITGLWVGLFYRNRKKGINPTKISVKVWVFSTGSAPPPHTEKCKIVLLGKFLQFCKWILTKLLMAHLLDIKFSQKRSLLESQVKQNKYYQGWCFNIALHFFLKGNTWEALEGLSLPVPMTAPLGSCGLLWPASLV